MGFGSRAVVPKVSGILGSASSSSARFTAPRSPRRAKVKMAWPRWSFDDGYAINYIFSKIIYIIIIIILIIIIIILGIYPCLFNYHYYHDSDMML